MSVFHSLFHSRPRLTSALAAGIVVAGCAPSDWSLISHLLAGWNVAVWGYLILMGWLMTHADHVRVCDIARQEDESASMILALMSAASVVSLAAIVLELSAMKDADTTLQVLRYGFIVLTICGSWCLVGVLFTVHYARMFYGSKANARPLRFPNDEVNPNYWDFLYFSFTIAVAAQTSDVAVMSRMMRKVVLAHSVLSFIFNVAIIGLSINIAAGIVGTH